MKVLFTYRTLTGNTKKVIDAMYDELQVEKDIKPWDEVQSLEDYGLTFVGFPIEAMDPVSFIVTGSEGPLAEGEMEKTKEFSTLISS